ncbi:DUF445 domain-containing protein [Burkholderia sp. L27(2015)]|uniref:DUF445 domain-containing protein n=1 Tax=Burkholderia sp. L27(2015) TaxID=1641858 RepID=UPI00131AB5E2|nr:DUF445 domain-containing protein [Burkholderia sp. L27(2015)]
MPTPYVDSVYVRLARAEDEVKRIRLRRMQWVATGLLLFVTGLYIASVFFKNTSVAWPYVGAFAEAAMVGALADWFAVSALFRHPLGLSFIPHTAIIPKNKDRIADNLGDFVQGEFFSTERVTSVIRDFNPAQKLAGWLSDHQHADMIGTIVVKVLAYGLNALDETEVRSFLRKNVALKFNELDLSTFASQILRALTHEGRHQAILDQMLKGASNYINEPEIKRRIIDFAADKIPLYVKSWKDTTATFFIEKILGYVGDTLAEVDQDPNHPLRAEFDRAIAELIVKLKSDLLFRLKIKEYQEQLASNEVLADFVDSLWRDISAWIQKDLSSKQSLIHAKISEIAGRLGTTLSSDTPMQTWINDQILNYVPELLDRFRPKIGAFISGKMKEWKEHEVVNKLELNIGRDLQFIRLNGTFVGGLVGLIIHVATTMAA